MPEASTVDWFNTQWPHIGKFTTRACMFFTTHTLFFFQLTCNNLFYVHTYVCTWTTCIIMLAFEMGQNGTVTCEYSSKVVHVPHVLNGTFHPEYVSYHGQLDSFVHTYMYVRTCVFDSEYRFTNCLPSREQFSHCKITELRHKYCISVEVVDQLNIHTCIHTYSDRNKEHMVDGQMS